MSFWSRLWVGEVAVVGCVGIAQSRSLVFLSGEGLVSPCWQAGFPCLAMCWVCFDPNCPVYSVCSGEGARREEGACGACIGGQSLAWTHSTYKRATPCNVGTGS